MRARKTASAVAAIAGMAVAGLAAPGVAQAAPETQPQQAGKTVPGTQCDTQARACLSLGKNKAWLIKNGRISYGPVAITSGMPGYETPKGKHKVLWKNIDHWSSAYDAPMPWSVFFTSTGIAFHEESLSEESHGCIHLSKKSAATFFNALRTDDMVHVTA